MEQARTKAERSTQVSNQCYFRKRNSKTPSFNGNSLMTSNARSIKNTAANKNSKTAYKIALDVVFLSLDLLSGG